MQPSPLPRKTNRNTDAAVRQDAFRRDTPFSRTAVFADHGADARMAGSAQARGDFPRRRSFSIMTANGSMFQGVRVPDDAGRTPPAREEPADLREELKHETGTAPRRWAEPDISD